MPAFDEDDIRKLEKVLSVAMAKARLRRLPVTREALARKLFDAARTGERDPKKLVAHSLGGWDGDDVFPPGRGLRQPIFGAPIWQLPSLAA